MSVTIKTIAKVAGVNHSTVSRALRNDPRITEETAERIRRIAQELGYRPSRIGRGLKTNRTYTIGFAINSLANPVHAEIVHGIQRRLQSSDYSLLFAITETNPDTEAKAIRMFQEHSVDGILICPSKIGERHQAVLDELKIPTVVIHNETDYSWPHVVTNDDWHGAFTCTNYLIGLGHTHIGYLGIREGKLNEKRFMGYRAAMESAGLKIGPGDILTAADGVASAGKEAVQPWLDQHPCPSAILCFDDLLAIGAMQTFKMHGLRIPEDVSIIGFDDIEMAQYIDPPLTTFAQPKQELGYRAADMLLTLLAGKTDIQESVVLLGELKIRESVAPWSKPSKDPVEGRKSLP